MVHPTRALRSVLVAGVALTALTGCEQNRTDPARTAPAPTSAPAYRDGTYTATGWYGGLPSHIDVTVTLVDGTVTATSVAPQATDPTSRNYQDRFAAAAPALVVGRPVDQVALDHVAGSSGTPDGFNDALTKIRDQAGE